MLECTCGVILRVCPSCGKQLLPITDCGHTGQNTAQAAKGGKRLDAGRVATHGQRSRQTSQVPLGACPSQESPYAERITAFQLFCHDRAVQKGPWQTEFASTGEALRGTDLSSHNLSVDVPSSSRLGQSSGGSAPCWLAAQWLQASDAVREQYKRQATQLHEATTARQCRECTTGTKNSKSNRNEVTSVVRSPQDHTGGPTSDEMHRPHCSVPSSALAMAPDRVFAATTMKTLKRARTVGSFHFFHAANRHVYRSSTTASKAWAALSAEEKAPYDAAAAAQRTQDNLDRQRGAA